jgi:ankyrin repeat protein
MSSQLLSRKTNTPTGLIASMFDAVKKSDIRELKDAVGEMMNQQKGSQTMLQIASTNGSLEIVDFLLNVGANVNIGTPKENYTSLIYAIARNHVNIVKRLIAASADVNTKDSTGDSPLVYAVRGNNAEITEMLIDAGADVNDNDYRIFYVGKDQHIFEKLIEAGADINAVNRYGHTVLISVIYHRNPVWKIKMLIDKGADVNAKSTRGDTALFYTFDPEITKLLIQAGVDLNVQNKLGLSALHYIITNSGGNCVETVKLLIEAGINVNLKDKDGKTALEYAIRVSNGALRSQLIKIFIDAGAEIPKNPEYQLIEDTGLRKLTTEKMLKEFRTPKGKILEIANISDVPDIIPTDIDALILHPMNISQLPALPTSLKYLQCSGNPLATGLPSLPPSLEVLLCEGCGLTELPDLPETLRYLDARNNKLHDIARLPPNLFISPKKQLNDPKTYEDSSALLLSGNPLPLGLINGYGSITKYSKEHIHTCVEYNNETVCTMIIPKGTLLFRDSSVRYRKEELQGILLGKQYYMYPSFNVFFYPYPFVAETFVDTEYVNVFETIRDIEVVMGVLPSLNNRSDRLDDDNNADGRYVVSCDKIDTAVPNIKGYDYDPCLSIDFAEKHKNINGMFVLASADTINHIKNSSNQRFWSKYRTNHIDSRNTVGIPEVILHPHQNRFDKSSPLNYKHVSEIPHRGNSYDEAWRFVENQLKSGVWTIDLFTKMYVNYDAVSEEVKARCVPPEDHFKLYHLNTSYWAPTTLNGGRKTRRKRRNRGTRKRA